MSFFANNADSGESAPEISIVCLLVTKIDQNFLKLRNGYTSDFENERVYFKQVGAERVNDPPVEDSTDKITVTLERYCGPFDLTSFFRTRDFIFTLFFKI